MRHRMARYRDGRHKWWGTVVTDELIESLLAEIADRGASTARDLDDGLPRKKDHWGWNWSTTRRALDDMYMVGDVAIAGRNSQFEIRYDLPDRVIPREHPRGADPVRARRGQGSSSVVRRAHTASRTSGDLADYYRLRSVAGTEPDRCRARGRRARRGRRADPGGRRGRQAPARPPPRRADPTPGAGAHLASPFDPVVWERERTESLFDFFYRIEIYTPVEEAHLRLLRAAVPRGRPDRRSGRPQGRPQDRPCCWSRRRTPSLARPTRPPGARRRAAPTGRMARSAHGRGRAPRATSRRRRRPSSPDSGRRLRDESVRFGSLGRVGTFRPTSDPGESPACLPSSTSCSASARARSCASWRRCPARSTPSRTTSSR